MYVAKHMLQIMDEYIFCVHLISGCTQNYRMLNFVHFFTVFRVKEAL